MGSKVIHLIIFQSLPRLLLTKKYFIMFKFSSLMLCILLIAGHALSQTVVTSAVNDQLSPLVSVKMNGFVGNKMDASYRNRILAKDVDRLIAPFRNRTEDSCWQSEFWENGLLRLFWSIDINLKQSLK